MQIEIDQSIRIEELNKDSVIGIGGRDLQLGYVLFRKTKRHFNEYFRRLGLPKKCAPTLFAISIVVALRRSHCVPTTLVIDTEYDRYEEHIINIVQKFFRDAEICIRRIGKNSPAHTAAYFVHTKRRKRDGVISRNDIWYFLRPLMTDRRAPSSRVDGNS